MNRIAALGAVALLAVGLGAAPAAAAPVATDTSEYVDANTCKDVPEFADVLKVDTDDEPMSVTVDAPEGQVITKYCVKAASTKNGGGPLVVTLDEPAESVTIGYKDQYGKDRAISHYCVITTDVPTPDPSDDPSVDPSDDPSTDPSDDPSTDPSDGPSVVPSDESTEPGADPTDPTEPGATPEDDDDVLAATGAGPVIGYTLLALALAGGGVTLMVLRKRRMS